MTGEIIRTNVALVLPTGAELLISDKTRCGGKAVVICAIWGYLRNRSVWIPLVSVQALLYMA